MLPETDLDDFTRGRCHQMLEDTFLRMQAQFDASWADACHVCIAYGIDAMWLNISHDEALAELQFARDQIDRAMRHRREEMS